MTGVEVTELHTQDGWDWPNGVQDERWPKEAQPTAPPVKAPESASNAMRISTPWARHCVLADCRCARYGRYGIPFHGCSFYDA